MAEIDWRLLNTQFPQQLSDLFNPAAIQQRQAAVSDQQTMGQLRQAQLMEAAQGLRRAPELARREDLAYAQQQEAFKTQQANAARKQSVMGVLRDPLATKEQKNQALMELFPEEAAKQAFKPAETKADASAYFTPVQTAQGVMSFNARTGRMEPANIAGRPVIGAQADPLLQGRIAAAKEAGKGEAEYGMEARKSIKKSNQLLSISNKAEELLKKSPTGSGVGAAVDVLGRAVGVTSESAKTASELETLSGWMVSNVPRMEGPQSNIDVLNYQTMAAKVGDRSVPVPERMAALKVVKDLQEKYKELNQEVVGGGQQVQQAPTGVSAGQWSIQRVNK